MTFSTNYRGKELIDGGMSQEIEMIPNSIVLTREEFEKAIGDSYDWGRQREYEEQYMMNANAPDKQQYISSLISSKIE